MRAAAACLLALAGCGGHFGDDYNLVAGLRLLGVVAEPPEVAPGASTRLAALAVNDGGGAIDIGWSACLLPPIAGSGTIHPGCLAPDAGSALAPLGSGESIAFAVPSLSIAQLGPPDATGGVYLPVRLAVHDGRESLDGIYRLRIADPEAAGAGPANRNPAFAAIETSEPMPRELPEQEPLPVAAGARVTLRARFAAGSAESYRTPDCMDAAPCRTESLDVTWFATAGHFDPGSTGDAVDTVLALDRHPPAGPTVDLWVVARDGRGGSAIAHRQLAAK